MRLHDQDWIPSTEEKITLAAAGLGLKRLSFVQDGDDRHIKDVVYDAFPQLIGRGGFDILRPGEQSKTLMVVSPPPDGLTVPYLKDVVNQSKIYVRPSADDIEVSKNESSPEQPGSPSSPSYSPLSLSPSPSSSPVRTDNQTSGEPARLTPHPSEAHSIIRTSSSSEPRPTQNLSSYRHRPIQTLSSNTDPTVSNMEQHSVFINLVEESDEECEEELQLAIAASLEDCPPSSSRVPTSSHLPLEGFQQALVSFQSSLFTKGNDTYQRLTVRHSHIWDDSIQLFTRGISTNKQFKVTFLGEPAVDLGGPRREYFTLLLKAAANHNGLFEGPLDHRIPVHNMSALMEKTYLSVGRMFAASVLQGGPATTFLAESIAEYLLHGLEGVGTHKEDVPTSVQDLLVKVAEASDDAVLQEVLDSDELSCRFDRGVNKPSVAYRITDKQSILHLFCLHFVILQRKAEIDQLMEGLNDLGFLQFLKMHPGPARSLLVSGRQKLTAASLEQLFLVRFSEPGSNRRCEEERVMMMWLEYLQDVEDGRVQSDDECFSLTLENILQFATGATYPPPLGFDDNPEIGFAHDSTVTLPTANTCSPTLTLPTAITDIDIFKSRMTYAIFNSVGFGHV